MSKGKSGGTLNLGIAQDTLTKWTPWGSGEDGKARHGAEFGCDLVRGSGGKIQVRLPHAR